jgi:uncharacterized protein (TIGR02246 family)
MKRLMMRALSSLVVIGALSGCAQAPAPPAAQDTAAEEAKLEADALAWFDLYNKGDADGVANLYADDALLMPPGARASKGRAAIREFIAADIAKSRAASISLKNEAVTGKGISGDTGWLSGTYLVVDASGATIDTGNYLSVHRRTNGAWPYIRDIWNSDREAVTPPAATPTKTTGK